MSDGEEEADTEGLLRDLQANSSEATAMRAADAVEMEAQELLNGAGVNTESQYELRQADDPHQAQGTDRYSPYPADSSRSHQLPPGRRGTMWEARHPPMPAGLPLASADCHIFR